MSLYFNSGSISAGSGGGSDDTYTKAEINGLLSAKSNTGLDNLNASGQMVVDTQNGTISNCILEIPQNVKLTLENNVLTLKAGSTVVLGNSATYTTYTTTQDYSTTIPSDRANGTYVMTFAVGQGLWDNNIPINETYSGSTAPSTTYSHAIWFDTTNTIIKTWSNIQNTWQLLAVSYPLCNIDVKGGVASFAKDSNGNDMIFNGEGFIGHHAFVYPNVKELVPNGHNINGTLSSTLQGNSNLSIIEMNQYNKCIGCQENGTIQRFLGYHRVKSYSDIDISSIVDYHLYYVEDENNTYRCTNNSLNVFQVVPLIFFECDSSNNVTQFDIRQPYDGVRDLTTDNKQDVLTSITGYDSTQTQTLKNVNGTLTWVDD